jgi:transposase
MLRAPSKFIRPEPLTPRTLIDAARYYALTELLRELEAEIEAEARLRSPGQSGLGRREQFLSRTVLHLRRAAHSMKPLAGLESWTQAAE